MSLRLLSPITIGRTFLTVVCFLLLPRFSVFATSIVAIMEDKSVTIAADSVLLGNSVETGEPVRTSICKIRCVEHSCCAISGRYNNKTIGYDVWKLAERELYRRGFPQELSERFGKIVSGLAPKLIAVSKKETPGRYAEWLKRRPVLAYLFAGFDGNGESLVAHGQLMIDTEGRALPIQSSVRQGRSGSIDAVLLGRNEHIANFMKRNPSWRVSATTHPTELAERMVRIEIQASEDSGRRDVGEPIAVVRLLHATGFRLESKGVCQEK